MGGNETAARVLVVDDERLIRWSLHAHLEEAGYEAFSAADAAEARPTLAAGVDVVILDFRLPDVDGFAFLEETRRDHPEVPVVMLTGHSSVRHAVDAMRRGAFNYVSKPFETQEVLEVVAEAVSARRGKGTADPDAPGLAALLGESAAMRRLRETLARVAQSPAPTILIPGESGTGKDLAARCLHEASARADRPMVRETEPDVFLAVRNAFAMARPTPRPGPRRRVLEGSRQGQVRSMLNLTPPWLSSQ